MAGQGRLFELWQDLYNPAHPYVDLGAIVPGFAFGWRHGKVNGRRQPVVLVLIIETGQRQIFKVILAAHAPSGLAGSLDRREKQRDENANDGDDDKQLDQRETM